MNLLIAVKSCQRDRLLGCHTAILDTWGKNVPYGVDLRFFVGDIGLHHTTSKNEVSVEVPDDYDGLPYKTREILLYSLESVYDYTFLCDTDTFLILPKLMKCGFEKYDYSGRFGKSVALGVPFRYTDSRGITDENHYLTASGGLGYFLSRRAANMVVSSGEPTSWAEDMWVAQVLGPFIKSKVMNMKAKDLDDFECQVSWHFHHGPRLPKPMTTPEMQYLSYELGTPTLMYDAERKKIFEARK